MTLVLIFMYPSDGIQKFNSDLKNLEVRILSENNPVQF